MKALAKRSAAHDRIGMTDCLIRTKKIERLSRGGNQNKSVHQDSIVVNPDVLVTDEVMLVADDVTASGNPLYACRDILPSHGAKRVVLPVLGKQWIRMVQVGSLIEKRWECSNMDRSMMFLEKYPIKKYDVKKLYGRWPLVKGVPDYLYYRGDISLLKKDVVAVIGSREISWQGKEAAKSITRALCRRGKTILNGLALGCDMVAVKEAMDCGGRAVAVMPGDLDEIYPKAGRNLAEELLEKGGCLVSEYPAGIRPGKESFVARDRLQALFSDLVIVAESRQGSGTWHTVRYAKKYGKIVACCVGKETKADDGNGILVRDKKAYALKDDAGLDYILEMSQNRYEQMTLPI